MVQYSLGWVYFQCSYLFTDIIYCRTGVTASVTLFFNTYLQEMVGKFNADFYYLNGLTLESRKRREHLSEEDLQKNKAIVESFTRGGGTHSFDEVSFCC